MLQREGEGGPADTEVSGKRYAPPRQQFQRYVTMVQLYETSSVLLYCTSKLEHHAQPAAASPSSIFAKYSCN